MPFGLTDAGFDTPTFEEWLAEYRTRFKDTFGLTDNISESTLVSDLLSIFAFEDIQIWQALEAIYNSQTINGAEGIYLDEVLGRRGVFRQGAQPSTGIAILETNRTAPWITTIPTTSIISGSNEILYNPDVDTQLRDNLYALKLPLTDFGSSTSTTFFAKNSSDSSDVQITLNPQDVNFLTDLASWFQDNVYVDDIDLVFVDSSILYIGFLSTDLTTPVGVENATFVYSDLRVGQKWSGVPVTASTNGFKPLSEGELSAITPASYTSGATTVVIESVTNFEDFFSGAESETDAEYRARFNNIVDEATAATRPAIRSALLKLDGVSKVRIYDNPTDTATPEAPAFAFQTVVLGGTTTEIAQKIYETKPINTLAFGSVDTVINTEDGGSETVGFTPATQSQINVRITYSTVDDRALSTTEQNTIKNNLVSLATNFLIGGQVFNAQLKSAVFSAVAFNKIRFLQIATKKVTDPESAYSTLDYTSTFSEIVLISKDNVLFDQEV